MSFLLLVSLLFSTVLATITFMLYWQFRHQASAWFGFAAIGLGSFVMEILIYRYGLSLSAPEIVAFSKFWALTGGLLLTVAMPQLARLMTGSTHTIAWRITGLALPGLTLGAGIGLLLGLGGGIIAYLMQFLIFGSAIACIAYIALVRPKDGARMNHRNLIGLLLWSALCLPLIILDAIGGVLPASLNDVPMGIFLPGICLITIFELPGFFGKPTYLQAGQASEYFLKHFEISSRESEVVSLVLEGVSNSGIAERLFISAKTVENHLTNIFRKTGVKNRIQLFRLINSSRD